MIRSVSRRSYPVAAALAAASLIILLSSCGVPLAPGYQIQKETLAVHFVAANPPYLAIRAEYRLANIGNSPLHFVAVVLPGQEEFGRADLHAEIDGKEIAPEHSPAESPQDWRIPLPAPWRQKEKRGLSLAYDLAAQRASDPRIFVAANAFYLNDSGWFPTLLGFKALFSPPVVRPDPTELGVTLPADFRVAASGQPRGKKNQGGEVTYRFLVRKADFAPYVVAGRYQEQKVSADGLTVIFWSSGSPSPTEEQRSGAEMAAAEKFYAQTFGALPANAKSILDLSFLDGASRRTIDDDASILPLVVDGAMLTWQADLADTWFGHLIRPDDGAFMLAEALSRYAESAFQEKSGASRKGLLTPDLTAYDSERANALEKPILSLTRRDREAQLRLGGDKSALFLFALEDKCGQQNVAHAIAHMVYALHGQPYGYSDFRAALEHECHQNLADFFHAWLARPGIPPDFRTRYENAGGNQK